jgi:hypothetical protein
MLRQVIVTTVFLSGKADSPQLAIGGGRIAAAGKSPFSADTRYE